MVAKINTCDRPLPSVNNSFVFRQEPNRYIHTAFLEMIRTAAADFPASISDAPVTESASGATPALNLNLGAVSVSLGGHSRTGVQAMSHRATVFKASDIVPVSALLRVVPTDRKSADAGEWRRGPAGIDGQHVVSARYLRCAMLHRR